MTGRRLDDPGRRAAIERSGLTADISLEALERVSRLVTHITGAPLALVNVITDAEQISVAGTSRSEGFAAGGVIPLSNSFCQHVVTGGAPLVVSDARADERLTGNLGITEDNVIAYLGVPLYAPDGHILGALCAVDGEPREWTDADRQAMNDLGAVIADEVALREATRDIEALNAALVDEARRDPLTALGNRRLWEEQGSIELSRAERDRTPLTVVIMDLDGFKAVNDEQGHAAGDDLLRSVALTWIPLVRLPDVIVRLGGDEFGVLLPGAAEGHGDVVGERLRDAVRELIGVSYGVARWQPGETFANVVARADVKLYERKRERERPR